jgi:UPF0755 protein
VASLRRLLLIVVHVKREGESGEHMMAKVGRVLKVVFIATCALLAGTGIVLGIMGFQFWLFLKSPGSARLEIKQVQVAAGMNAASVAQLLFAEGIIADPEKFYLLCRWHKTDQKLRAGEYAFLSLSTPGQILDQMVSGRAIIQRVTLPEGATLRDVARTLQEKGLASVEDILRLAVDRDFILSNGLQVPSLEGYLFPETYHFQKIQNEVSMLKAMVRQFRRHLPEGWEQQAAELGLSLHEIVILASMVEKEAAVDYERPLIAGVFYNRLRENMPLQSDPTAVYDVPGFSGRITRGDLKRVNPYNTYQMRGLPKGPICNPGAQSLKAALYPEKAPYLYFVSNLDGTHQFSQTLVEHNEAVSRSHQKRRDRAERADRQPRTDGR